jgi:uncharacterized protein YbbK (DUF523 family)
LLQRRMAEANKTLEVEMAAVGSGLSVEAALKTPSSPAVPSPHLGAPSPGAAVARLQQQRASAEAETYGDTERAYAEEEAASMSKEGLVELCDELVNGSTSPRTWERINHPVFDGEAAEGEVTAAAAAVTEGAAEVVTAAVETTDAEAVSIKAPVFVSEGTPEPEESVKQRQEKKARLKTGRVGRATKSKKGTKVASNGGGGATVEAAQPTEPVSAAEPAHQPVEFPLPAEAPEAPVRSASPAGNPDWVWLDADDVDVMSRLLRPRSSSVRAPLTRTTFLLIPTSRLHMLG